MCGTIMVKWVEVFSDFDYVSFQRKKFLLRYAIWTLLNVLSLPLINQLCQVQCMLLHGDVMNMVVIYQLMWADQLRDVNFIIKKKKTWQTFWILCLRIVLWVIVMSDSEDFLNDSTFRWEVLKRSNLNHPKFFQLFRIIDNYSEQCRSLEVVHN